MTVTDTAGNSYASAAPATTWNNGAWSSQVFYAKNVAGGANTVRATFAQRDHLLRDPLHPRVLGHRPDQSARRLRRRDRLEQRR